MIQVVLHLVIFRQTPQIRRLHLEEVIYRRLSNRERHYLRALLRRSASCEHQQTRQARQQLLSVSSISEPIFLRPIHGVPSIMACFLSEIS